MLFIGTRLNTKRVGHLSYTYFHNEQMKGSTCAEITPNTLSIAGECSAHNFGIESFFLEIDYVFFLFVSLCYK